MLAALLFQVTTPITSGHIPFLQVLDFLQDGSMDVLVAGDSMMRQLYIRLVHMMRGAPRVLDYHIHTHANYAVRCHGRN